MNRNLLTGTIFLPLIFSLVVSLLPKRMERAIFVTGGIGMVLAWLASLQLFLGFDAGAGGFQFLERHAWIPSYGISYAVGIDGISLVLIVLTTTLSALALLGAYGAIRERAKEFVIAILFLETGMTGTFAALDLFLFYVFWEAVLVPMYLIIGVWGGPRRIHATLKFFLYTMAGSVLMLIGILALYSFHKDQFGAISSWIPDLYRLKLPLETQVIFFVLFALAFAIKIPLFPFHTWLPDAHVEAPTAGSVLLAAILLKMGGYGFLRLALPLFPAAAVAAAPFLGFLGTVGIVYGALAAWAQEDVKKLVAYSSVGHMGFVVLGIASLNPAAISGAVFQMVAHGVSTGALFLLVGLLYERRHTRMIGDFGGAGEGDAPFERCLSRHHAGVDRSPGALRLCRGVPRPERIFFGERARVPGGSRFGIDPRDHPGRRVHALDV
ncbi:MAG: NADH-quinone oxidoreductase subunit M [Pseudomonadota bacterium]